MITYNLSCLFLILAPMPNCRNDIALLKLAGNGIDVGASDIELMCLPVGSDATYSQTECIVAGWGWTRKHFYLLSGEGSYEPVARSCRGSGGFLGRFLGTCLGGFLGKFVRACTENLVNQF